MVRRVVVMICLLSPVACGISPRSISTSTSKSSPVAERSIVPAASMVGGAVVRRLSDVSRTLAALVMLGAEGESLCSGTILDERTILTAAHCVDHDPHALAVVFGPRVRGVERERVRPADAVVQHPAWRRTPGRGDVALVRFQGGLPEGFRPVLLAGPRFRLNPRAELLMIGYGTSDPQADFGSAGVLRQTRSLILGFARPDQIVVDESRSGACFGDSGGPAFTLEDNQIVQVGLAHSVLNPTCDEASFYTGVMLYADWILKAAARLAQVPTGA